MFTSIPGILGGARGRELARGVEQLVAQAVSEAIQSKTPDFIDPLVDLVIGKAEKMLEEVVDRALLRMAGGSSTVTQEPTTAAALAPAPVLHVSPEKMAEWDGLSTADKLAAVKAATSEASK